MPTDPHADDVAAASAAYLANLLPVIAALPAKERYERLRRAIEASLAAYRDGLNGWPGVHDPSDN